MGFRQQVKLSIAAEVLLIWAESQSQATFCTSHLSEAAGCLVCGACNLSSVGIVLYCTALLLHRRTLDNFNCQLNKDHRFMILSEKFYLSNDTCSINAFNLHMWEDAVCIAIRNRHSVF